MIPQLDNQVLSSVLLWADHALLDKGGAFSNFSGSFYPIKEIYNGYYSYGLPFKQINADRSINGAHITSGVYLNNNFITVGQSGLVAINQNEGHVYFSQDMDSQSLSAAYSVKDYSIYLNSEPEEKLLFETKYEVKPKTTRSLTGLAPQTMTYPVIFIKNDGSENEPFAFGGTDTTKYYIRAIVISDSQFSLDAVTSIFRDKVRTFIPLIEPGEMPFNSYGDVGSGYNYTSLTAGKTNSLFISKVSNSRLSYRSTIMNEIRSLNPSIFPSLIDIEAEIVRQPRA